MLCADSANIGNREYATNQRRGCSVVHRNEQGPRRNERVDQNRMITKQSRVGFSFACKGETLERSERI